MGNNTFTGNYSDGAALTKAMLDTAYQSLQPDISNTSLMTIGSSSGQVLTSNGSGSAASFQDLPEETQGIFALKNYSLKATVATGVMTITLNTQAGTTPDSTNPIVFNYSSNGATSATYTTVNVTGATTFTLTASATLGISSTITNRVFVYGYYSTGASAVKLAVGLRNDFDTGTPVTTVAMAASADSINVLYASASLTVVPRLLGYIDAAHNSGFLWQTPSKVNLVNGQLDNFETGRRTASSTSNTKFGQTVLSASCGAFSTGSTTYQSVTNLSVTLVNTGRPVRICLVSDGSTDDSHFLQAKVSASTSYAQLRIRKNGTTTIGTCRFGDSSTGLGEFRFPAFCEAFDFGGAGSNVYSVELLTTDTSNVVYVNYVKLLAYEI